MSQKGDVVRKENCYIWFNANQLSFPRISFNKQEAVHSGKLPRDKFTNIIRKLDWVSDLQWVSWDCLRVWVPQGLTSHISGYTAVAAIVVLYFQGLAIPAYFPFRLSL